MTDVCCTLFIFSKSPVYDKVSNGITHDESTILSSPHFKRVAERPTNSKVVDVSNAFRAPPPPIQDSAPPTTRLAFNSAQTDQPRARNQRSYGLPTVSLLLSDARHHSRLFQQAPSDA